MMVSIRSSKLGTHHLGGLFFLLGPPPISQLFRLFLRSGQKGADRFFRRGFSKSCLLRGKRRNPMPTSPAPIAASSSPSRNPNAQSFSAKSKARRRKKKSKFGSRRENEPEKGQ